MVGTHGSCVRPPKHENVVYNADYNADARAVRPYPAIEIIDHSSLIII